jgi:hypothetical protein
MIDRAAQAKKTENKKKKKRGRRLMVSCIRDARKEDGGGVM